MAETIDHKTLTNWIKSLQLDDQDIFQILESGEVRSVEVERTDDDTEEKEEENIPIRLTIGSFNSIPASTIPSDCYKSTELRTVFGIDAQGYVYVAFGEDESQVHYLTCLNHMYHLLDLSQIAVELEDVEIGGYYVARKTEKNIDMYVRVQVLKIMIMEGEQPWICALEIDEQQLHRFKTNNLFMMLDHFYQFPSRVVKCSLLGLEDFLGTGIIIDALLHTGYAQRQMYVHVMDDKDEGAVPKVLIYNNLLEAKSAAWSFNMDLQETIKTWNEQPLELEKGMVLTNTRVTDANRQGRIWIQLQSKLLSFLADLKPSKDFEAIAPVDLFNSLVVLWNEGERNFAKRVDGAFRRVVVKNMVGGENNSFDRDTEVVIMHTDYGIQELTYFTELTPLTFFNQLVKDIPAQGFFAHLANMEQGTILSSEATKTLTGAEHLQICIEQLPQDLQGKRINVTVYFPRGVWNLVKREWSPTPFKDDPSSSSILLPIDIDEELLEPTFLNRIMPFVQYPFPLRSMEITRRRFKYHLNESRSVQNRCISHIVHLEYHKF